MANWKIAACAQAVVLSALLSTAPAYGQTELDKIIERAERGEPTAQAWLGSQHIHGTQYTDGTRIEKDGAKAVHWLTKAAAQDVQLAQFLLGQLYYEGELVERDESRALRLLADAAHHKDQEKSLVAPAQYMIGMMTYRECTHHLKRQVSIYACRWDERGAKRLTQSYGTAAMWFEKAAAAGHRDAMFHLATMYEAGRGVPQDFNEAARLFRSAVEAGDSAAMWPLAEVYVRMQDYVSAYMWFNLLAAGDGVSDAAKKREEMSRRITAAQVAEAQRLAREWAAQRRKKK